MPSEHAAVDFETSRWTTPVTVAYKDESAEIVYDEPKNTEKLLHQLFKVLHARKPEKVWAHNGGKFDWLIVLEYAKSLLLPMKASVKAGRIVFAEIDFGDYRCKLYDSYAVAQASLKKCAKAFELESAKHLQDEDYKIDALKWGKQKRCDGALADVRCTYELIQKLQQQFEEWGGELKATFSSSALSVLKKYVGGLPRISEKANTFARESYFGGRVEVFRHKPEFMLAEWDINSSYPNAMTQALPWKVSKKPTWLGIVQATVTVNPKCELPVLPFRPESKGVYFPVGTWQGVFTLHELEYAAKVGALSKHTIGEAVYYETAPQKVSEYIETLYESKRTAKGAFREFCKLSLNGSYGKFGQAPEVESLIHFATDDDADEAIAKYPPGALQRIHPFENWHSLKETKWAAHTNYALASYVTSYARTHLHKLMLGAEKLCYVDTDSIHASANSTYSTGAELGQLKLEKEGIKRAHYYAPKIYEFHTDTESHYACKGFPVDGDTFAKTVAGESITTERMQLFKSQLKRASKFQRHGVELPPVNKSWKMISPKRKIVPGSEGYTLPWSVDELALDVHLKQKTP